MSELSATPTPAGRHATSVGASPPLNAFSRNNWLVLGGFALFTFAIHLIFYKGYGFFRDELYFIACGKHLAWGYVDQPPGAPLVAWFSVKILGHTLFAIRFVPVLFATAQILLTGLTARAMGGRNYAQFLACLCVLVAPQYFDSFLNTDMFMMLGWAACAWVVTRIFAGERPQLWLLFGLFAGLALEGKHAMLFFLLAFLVAMIVSPQRIFLLTPWPWCGAGVAFLIALPNLIWEYTHHWATYELLSDIAKSDKNLVLGPWQYLHSNIDALGFLTVLVWVSGLVWCLFLKGGQRFRALGWTWICSYILFIALKGKDYYLTPTYPMLFAAGAVAIESWFAVIPRTAGLIVKVTFAVLIFARGAISLPFAMPVMSEEKFIAYEKALGATPSKTENTEINDLSQQYADMHGWPELAASVAKVYNSIPEPERAQCAIFMGNYGEAGAIDYFGPQYGLPPAISGHQNYWFWGPRNYTGECLVIMAGQGTRELLAKNYTSVVQAGETYANHAIPFENHRAIWIYRGRKNLTLQDLWPQLKLWI
jgi:Dolichyl-phosphate-mannose-protein mannosyltransferase